MRSRCCKHIIESLPHMYVAIAPMSICTVCGVIVKPCFQMLYIDPNPTMLTGYEAVVGSRTARRQNSHGVEARVPLSSKMSTPRWRQHGVASEAGAPGCGGAPKIFVFDG